MSHDWWYLIGWLLGIPVGYLIAARWYRSRRSQAVIECCVCEKKNEWKCPALDEWRVK